MNRLATTILLVLLSWPAVAAEPVHDLRLCYEYQAEWSRISPGGTEPRYLLLKVVETRLGLHLTYIGMPWKRCFNELLNGRVEGAAGASFLPERQVSGVYPTDRDGRPDPTKRLSTSTYHLYVLKGSDLGWDGQRFSNLRGPIATLAGYSIIEQLKSSGATVYEMGGGADQALSLFQLALGGRAQAAAMVTPGGDAVLRNHPDLAARIVKYPVPLIEKPYYLVLSHQLVDADPALAERIWSTIADVRESAEYRAAIQPVPVE